MKNQQLNQLIFELETNINDINLVNQTISKSSVGWQIEHALLTIDLIIEALIGSNPNIYKWTFSFPRLMVFTLNTIPRGRAESPDVVLPKIYNTNSIKNHFEDIKERIKILNTLDNKSHFKHPYFGILNLKSTIRFLEIHTNHHLEIIRDIIKNSKTI